MIVLYLGCYNSYLLHSTCQTLSVNKMNNELAAEKGKEKQKEKSIPLWQQQQPPPPPQLKILEDMLHNKIIEKKWEIQESHNGADTTDIVSTE